MKPTRSSALFVAGIAGIATVAALLPATAQAVPLATAAVDMSSIRISEIANGGPGATSNASRVSADDFIEIGNFGNAPVDISGLRILRCGQTGDAYGPQKVVPAGTVLAAGDTYTVGSATSTNKTVVKRDADYDATGSTLHEFGFGAYLETPDYTYLDGIGFYHPNVDSDCENPVSLARSLDHRLGQSHQRIANTGNPETDWIVAGRTPDAPNASAAVDNLAPSAVKISEANAGDTVSTNNQFVELTNYGSEPIDVSGWKLYRCGENGTAYNQHAGLPAGTSIPAGGTYLYAQTSANLPGSTVDQRYPTAMAWRDFGVMITTPTDRIVDRVGFYADRNSICTVGSPQAKKASSLQNESFHRVGDTGDSSKDFMLAQERTPGVTSSATQLTAPAKFKHSDLRISELVGAGEAGANDEFVEIANYGTSNINLAGYSLTRCEGTGRGNAGYQVEDLGDITLRPGDVYVATDNNAPAELREIADGIYTTGLADTEGYGMYLRNPDGRLVDAVGVYETVTYSPCVIGSELRGYTKFDEGESYQRARTTGDNEEDFMKTPDRTPGVLADVAWVDPTEPLAGELDEVEIKTPHVPGTPDAMGKKVGDGYRASITTKDADGGRLDVELRSSTVQDPATAKIYAGSTKRKVPTTLTITGERRVATAQSLTTKAGQDTYPFQRFAVPVAAVPDQGVEFTWSGKTADRNEIQMYAWNGEKWTMITAASPSADGDLTLVGTIEAGQVTDGVANVLVIDGPRTSGGAVDEIGVTNQAFLDPQDYDFAFNQMSDTQFLAEGFRDVFRQMVTWVVANADARKIAYSTNTGDIIENWIGGNADKVRAKKEFAAAKKIHTILNDANVPNGVLPGNHDSFWGRNNDLYNEYFGPDMYEDEKWFGASWKKGDNSAHYDFFEANGAEFLALSLPYRPSEAQIAWGKEVAASYPKHNVILLTHSYLNTEKEIENRDSRYTARGEDLWRDLIAPSDNIFLVMGGHYHGVATKYGDPVTGEQSDAIEIAEDTVAVRNVGETGRMVVQMLADYQGYRSTQPEGRADTLDRDSGFQRLLQFDLDAELMAANAYSPTLKSFEAYKYDEPGKRGTPANNYQDGRYLAVDDEFVAKIDLLIDKDLASDAWSLGSVGEVVETTGVAAGEPATIAIPAAVDGLTWYAKVTDSSQRSVVSRPVAVSMEEEPAPVGAPTTTELIADEPAQRYGAAGADRVQLFASVTAEGNVAARGTIRFTEGTRVLGEAAISNGVARFRVAGTLAVGSHKITATFVPADAAVLASSTSAAVTVKVAKAVAVATASLTKTSINAKQRTSVTVRVRASGTSPTGQVRVAVKRGGKTRIVTGTLRNGKVKLALPKLKKGTYTVSAWYRGSATVATDAAPSVRLKVR